jgi:hypothetical protein
MKLRLPRRRVWRVAIYLGALLLIAIAIDLIIAHSRRTIRPGYLTTRIVQPRLPDGRIDYAVAIDTFFSRGVTPQNNAAVPLLQALGRQAISDRQPVNGVTDALGMPPVPEAGEYFIAYEDSTRTRRPPATNEAIDFSLPYAPSAYPTEVTPEIREWVKANERVLPKIIEATRRRRFFIPLFAGHRTVTLVEVQLKHVKALKEVGAVLHARALMRLEAGNGAGFTEDILTVHRIARLLGQSSTMVERVVAMAIEVSASLADVAAARSGKLTPQQARDLIAALTEVGDLPGYVDTIDRGERFLGHDIVQALAAMPPTEAGRLFNALQDRYTAPPWLFRFLPIPYERTMREMNQAYDGMVVAAHQPTYAQRVEALRLWITDVDREVQSGAYVNLLSADWAISLLLPTLERANERTETARMWNHLARVALALAAFKAEKGSYPASLVELSPAYLRDVPIDSFVERPLVYARQGDGYRLYSVGPNMKDDDGGKDELLIDSEQAGTTTKTSSTGPARS